MAAGTTGVRFTLRALRHRRYRLFFIGQAISLIGTWMGRIAMAWLVYRITGSAWMLGVVAFAGHLPTFLISPLAGAVVDRWQRHRVLIGSQVALMALTLALAALTLADVIAVWHVIAFSIIHGVAHAFDIPARQALVVDLIEDRDDLPNAIALNSTLVNGGRIIGPAIAGILIAAVGEGLCFLIDGLSYLIVIATLLALRIVPVERATPTGHLLRHLGEGLRYAMASVPIRSILLLMALVSFVGVPYLLLLPVFAQDVLGGGARTLGYLNTASGCGALVGGLYLASRRGILGLGRVIALSALLLGGALIGFAYSRLLWLSLALLPLAGCGMMVVMAGCNTILQTLVDDNKRGRVMSLFAMAFMGAAPLGNLLAGAVAEAHGAPVMVAAGGVACMLSAAWFACALPRLRSAGRPVYIARGLLPQEAECVEEAVKAPLTAEG